MGIHGDAITECIKKMEEFNCAPPATGHILFKKKVQELPSRKSFV